jgi:hypothetical protein
VQKRAFRYRTKKEDEATGVVRNKIPIEKLSIIKGKQDISRLVCGVRRIDKKSVLIKKFMVAGNEQNRELRSGVSGTETISSTPINAND